MGRKPKMHIALRLPLARAFRRVDGICYPPEQHLGNAGSMAWPDEIIIGRRCILPCANQLQLAGVVSSLRRCGEAATKRGDQRSMTATADPANTPEILRRLRAGDADAYELLVREFGGRMLAAARRLLANEEDARDAVQEAFLSAFKAIGQFEGASQLSTWLHRIVINAALMKRRTKQRRPEMSIESLLPQFLDDGHQRDAAVEWRDTGPNQLQAKELRAYVRECVDQLPENYRNVILLRDIEELDTQETASVLKIEPGAVKVRLHRARQALRTLLDKRLSRDFQ